MNDTRIRNAKAKAKQYKLTDARGLYLIVRPNGSKWWRWDYRYQGKRKTLSMGVYPDVSLKAAREKVTEAREQLASGTDPADLRVAASELDANTFEAIAREWFEKHRHRWTEAHGDRSLKRLENHVFPHIGAMPMEAINALLLLGLGRRLEDQGKLETAHRVLNLYSQVFRYAIATGRAGRDPVQDLKGALPQPKVKHHASVTDPRDVGQLLQSIDAYPNSPLVRSALRFAALVFVRPGELRLAKWSEFHFENLEWRIPAERMKMRDVHIVPLSRQALGELETLRALSRGSEFVFPSVRAKLRPISDNTLNAALRLIGYSREQMTAHGFRSMASTLLNEMGWNPDAIERQLAHAPRNRVRAAYNYADYLQERRTMMQVWADYLDRLRTGDERRLYAVK